MDNLRIIEKYIKEFYPDLKVFNKISVSYIKNLADEEGVIFVCHKNENKLQFVIKDSDNGNNATSTCSEDTLNITGSPLKDTCHLDDLHLDLGTEVNRKFLTRMWCNKEQHFIPIDLNNVRSIISHFSMKNFDRIDKKSIWFLCDGKDKKRTVLLQIKPSAFFNERAVVFYQGIVHSDDISMSNMMGIHVNEIGIRKVETSVECIYNISLNSFLKVIWNSSCPDPPLNNFKNSDITLYQTIEVGKPCSATEDLWMQLLNLYHLKNDILNYDSSSNKNELVLNSQSCLDLEIIRENILSLLTDISGFQENEIDSPNSEIGVIVRNVANRPDYDLTDQLWNLLKCCSCYSDLKSAMNFIFYCAAKYNVVNMPTSENCLAEIIKEISEHRLAIPCLVDTEPLKLLLEIGLEKISKDYEYIFSTNKICSSNQLKLNNINKANGTDKNKSVFNINTKNDDINNATPPERKSLFHNFDEEHNVEEEVEGFHNSKFNRNEVENKLARLIQIHLILEHLISIQNHLNLENVNSTLCEQLLKKPFKLFENVMCNTFDKIEIPITIDDVFSILKQTNPQSRKITMYSKNNFKEIQSTFYFNEANIFPSDTFAEMQIDDNQTMQNTYYHWHMLSIKTKVN